MRLVVLNQKRDPRQADCGRRGAGGVGALARDLPPGRVVFGSHFPFFYFEALALKAREAVFADADAKAILEDNARHLLGAR